MKAVLIQAPCWTPNTPPYNLALLKAVCQEKGHSVTCMDLNIRFYRYLREKAEERIYDNPTDWYDEAYAKQAIERYPEFIDKCVRDILNIPSGAVGFTITGLNRFFSEEIAARIKERDKERIIIFGGPQCFKTELGRRILSDCACVDAVCYLEGEKSLPALLDIIESKRGRVEVPGIAFRHKDGDIIDPGDANMVEDLNSLPFADFGDFRLEDYLFRELPISTSRGCINRCIFCSEASIWGKFRFREADNIFKEIRYQMLKHSSIRSFFFNNSLINGDMKSFDELCDLLLKDRAEIQWGGQAAIRKEMSGDILQKAGKAGLSHLSYGLESASARVLNAIGKRFTPQLAERVIRDTKEAGIRADVNIVIGFLQENEDDIMETADFLKRNKRYIDDIFFHTLVISNGSYLYKKRGELGIRFENEFNPASWYFGDGKNTPEKRLKLLEFYKSCLGDRGESFFSLSSYYSFIADDYFNKGDYKRAEQYFTKAKELNNDMLKNQLIGKKIELTRARCRNI